ncbi:MAG TPA: head-tail adaptor protein [Xanthobacteraceae bacterium]|nr:head-tail adaptor protein [Xanthobacteraceae bacterium]
MIDPGRLNTRLAIQAPQNVPDGQGGVVRGYVTEKTVWALVTPLGSREAVAGDVGGATHRCRIVIRDNVAITLQHRLIERHRILRIVAIGDSRDRGFLEIEAEWRDA